MRIKPPVIAFIEGNPADAELLRFALQKTGTPLEIVVLKDGESAVKYLAEGDRLHPLPSCDLTLLDLNLPVLSGFEVLEHIRPRDELKQIPVVVMSCSSNYEDVNRCYRAGANSYISKATDLDEVLAVAAALVPYWFGCVKLPCSNVIPSPLLR